MEPFEQSELWQKTLGATTEDIYRGQRERLRGSYLEVRDRASFVLQQIAKELPDLTVHDVSHADSLWEMAGLLLGAKVDCINPAEAYVLGTSFLLHDAALSVVAYEGGLEEVRRTTEWKDALAAGLARNGLEVTAKNMNEPPPAVVERALFETLRACHASRAATLPGMKWKHPGTDEDTWLIQDEDIRGYYGACIGSISRSHWIDVWRLPGELQRIVTAGPKIPACWTVNPLKIACILRAADAAHLDYRRAPSLLMALVHPKADSQAFWEFQGRLGKPIIESNAIIFSGGEFEPEMADAWWTCYDALRCLDSELKRIDVVLQDNRQDQLAATRVAGIESPGSLAKLILTRGWTPIDASVRVTDITHIVNMFGGEKLYGKDPNVPLRELIQNAADAIRAKSLLTGGASSSLAIQVSLRQEEGGWWLHVTDNGIGMSARVLTEALVDFGNRFWTGSLVRDEFPGLLGKGMRPRGAFGIGFFSVFSLADRVKVTSWKYGLSMKDARVLEFRKGLVTRPLLREPTHHEALLECGTRVSLLLRTAPDQPDGILWGGTDWERKPILKDLRKVVASIAPTIDVTIEVIRDGSPAIAVGARDWITIPEQELLERTSGNRDRSSLPTVRLLADDEGRQFGRAAISLIPRHGTAQGVVTLDGLRVAPLHHLAGVLLADAPETIARDMAFPSVPREVLAAWATEQAQIIDGCRSDLADSDLITAAGIVVACGGKVGNLPVGRLGEEGISLEDLRLLIAEREEVIVFAESLDYDEDVDDVLPRDFRNALEFSPNVLHVPDDPQPMIRFGTKKWPECLLDEDKGLPKSLIGVVWKEVGELWGELDEEDIETTVATVRGMPVTREATRIFRVRDED